MTAHEITIAEALRHAKLVDLREPLAEIHASEVLRNLRANRETWAELMEDCRAQDAQLAEECRDLLATLVYQAMLERMEEHAAGFDEKLRRYVKSLARKLR